MSVMCSDRDTFCFVKNTLNLFTGFTKFTVKIGKMFSVNEKICQVYNKKKMSSLLSNIPSLLSKLL